MNNEKNGHESASNTSAQSATNERQLDSVIEYCEQAIETNQFSVVPLTDANYDKSLELSSRALTEYILYRQFTIDKLKKIDKDNSEADIHNLIVPKGTKKHKSEFMNDLYSNNAWLKTSANSR